MELKHTEKSEKSEVIDQMRSEVVNLGISASHSPSNFDGIKRALKQTAKVGKHSINIQ
jgi:hypothetical protein